jgi:hypothetical protein
VRGTSSSSITAASSIGVLIDSRRRRVASRFEPGQEIGRSRIPPLGDAAHAGVIMLRFADRYFESLV